MVCAVVRATFSGVSEVRVSGLDLRIQDSGAGVEDLPCDALKGVWEILRRCGVRV